MWTLLGAFAVCGLLSPIWPSAGDALAAQEKKDKLKKGRTIGVLTAKKDNFIEVKADGEVKGRKYVPRWIGGLPADGGGLDKTMLKTFRALKVGSRVEVEWIFEERLRAVKVKVLQETKKEEPKD
ncbi:MAG: hypothetical protein FJ271_25360 [Planctomycetes bacterium]|nr:hypothetical protein [Planctomycetota bacterium]